MVIYDFHVLFLRIGMNENDCHSFLELLYQQREKPEKLKPGRWFEPWPLRCRCSVPIVLLSHLANWDLVVMCRRCLSSAERLRRLYTIIPIRSSNPWQPWIIIICIYIHHLRTYNRYTKRPAPNDLITQLVEHYTGIAEVRVQISVAWNFQML